MFSKLEQLAKESAKKTKFGRKKVGKKVRRHGVKIRMLETIGRPGGRLYPCIAGAGAILLAAVPHDAKALNLYDGANAGNNVEVNLTTTVEYSTFYRVNDPSAVLTSAANANGSEGDLNFRHGFVANEFEALPVLDIRDGDFGLHASGEFYLNTPYLATNQNDQPGTLNPFSVAKNDDFTSATRNVNGEDARLLDAFVSGAHEFQDGQSITLKVGRQTLFWGQSLFFDTDSIAAGQAPVDIITAQSLPNAQAQQIFLPVGQVVGTYQTADGTTIQGYYQFEWQPDNFQGVGAYFNSSDILDKGGQRLILGAGAYAFRQRDLSPPDSNGQFGLSVQKTFGSTDLGLYALRYDAKAPQIYLALSAPTGTPEGLSLGKYRLVYPRDIQLYGASVSKSVGPVNLGGEISGRRNMPLVSGLGESTPANPGNANSSPLYAVGDTVAAQGSMIYISAGIPLDPGGISFEGEVEMDHVIDVTKNRSALTVGRQATAGAGQFLVTPTYNDVLPSLEVTFPIGVAYNFLGRSEMDASINHGTGSFNVGVTGTYRVNWIANLTYFDYLGKADPALNGLADRGYVELNLEHTF